MPLAVATLVKPGFTPKRSYVCYYRIKPDDRVSCVFQEEWNDTLAIDKFLDIIGINHATECASLEIQEKVSKDSYRPFFSYDSKTATLVDKAKKKLSRKERRMLRRAEKEEAEYGPWFADTFLIPNIGERLVFNEVVVTKDDKPTRKFV